MKKIFAGFAVLAMALAFGCAKVDTSAGGGDSTVHSGTSAPSGQGTGNVVTPPAQ